MKSFPLEPLSRVRALRLEAARRLVAERRAELVQAELRREQARQARSDVVDRRRHHQHACEAAMSAVDQLVADWFERAERHRAWLDNEIVKNDAFVATAELEVVKAQKRLDEEIAALRRLQAKFDALQTFRGEWQRGQQREQEQREERDGEELYRAPAAMTR
jgi:YscO-like protein